jgi:hypothetical protein
MSSQPIISPSPRRCRSALLDERVERAADRRIRRQPLVPSLPPQIVPTISSSM